MKLTTVGLSIPNIIIQNVIGVSVILTKEMTDEEVVFNINDLFNKIGAPNLISIIIFCNKEYAKEISNLNEITFENIDDIHSDCDSFAFITLTNNEIYLIGVDKEPFLNQQKGVTQEFKSLY